MIGAGSAPYWTSGQWNYGYGIDNDSVGPNINYFGYQGSNTRYRDFTISDGKENAILVVDGSAGSVDMDIITEGGNAVYNSSETPGGELGGTWASPTVDSGIHDDEYADIDGDTYTGAHDFGGATSLEIPNGIDPDVDAVGEISLDTNAANEVNDVSIRAYGDGDQFLVAKKIKHFTFTIVDPDGITGWSTRATTGQPIFHNTYGSTFHLTEIYASTDIDNYSFTLVETASEDNWLEASDTTVEAVKCTQNGQNNDVFYLSTPKASIDHTTIEAGRYIICEPNTVTDAAGLTITLSGWFDADVE